ncbi:hypothetical protein EMIT0210MI2_12583 [Priestia megaterium]
MYFEKICVLTRSNRQLSVTGKFFLLVLLSTLSIDYVCVLG